MIKRIINPNVCMKIIFLVLHNYIIYVNLANYSSRIKEFCLLGYVCFVYEFCIVDDLRQTEDYAIEASTYQWYFLVSYRAISRVTYCSDVNLPRFTNRHKESPARVS